MHWLEWWRELWLPQPSLGTSGNKAYMCQVMPWGQTLNRKPCGAGRSRWISSAHILLLRNVPRQRSSHNLSEGGLCAWTFSCMSYKTVVLSVTRPLTFDLLHPCFTFPPTLCFWGCTSSEVLACKPLQQALFSGESRLRQHPPWEIEKEQENKLGGWGSRER